MIQELLGGGKDINIFSSVPFPTPLPFTSPPPSSTTTTTTTCLSNSSIQTSTPATQSDSKTTLPNASNSSCVANNTSNNNNNNSDQTNSQKLRCPRCDSTNTKFCYYNNYNLTQPRHFCKTCRRYWTKGGTLRNVPIGGGCRKNKTVSSTTASSSPTSSMSVSAFSKSSLSALFRSAKGPLSTELLFPGLIGNGVLDPQSEISNPTFWPPQPPQNSHIRALLNPNPTQGLFDPYGANGAPTHLGSSFSRSHQHQMLNGLSSGQDNMIQNGGNINGSNIMELYQKLKSSGGYGYSGHENPGPLILGNVVGSTSTSTSPSPSPSLSSSMYMVSTALREGGAGENLGISNWPVEFSTLPINGAFP